MLIFIHRLVFAHDPTDNGDDVIPIGKQTLKPNHIFYTPCSGIWQSVWIESVPRNHIERLDLNADMNGHGKFTLSIRGFIYLTTFSQRDGAHFFVKLHQQRQGLHQGR